MLNLNTNYITLGDLHLINLIIPTVVLSMVAVIDNKFVTSDTNLRLLFFYFFHDQPRDVKRNVSTGPKISYIEYYAGCTEYLLNFIKINNFFLMFVISDISFLPLTFLFREKSWWMEPLLIQNLNECRLNLDPTGHLLLFTLSNIVTIQNIIVLFLSLYFHLISH